MTVQSLVRRVRLGASPVRKMSIERAIIDDFNGTRVRTGREHEARLSWELSTRLVSSSIACNAPQNFLHLNGYRERLILAHEPALLCRQGLVRHLQKQRLMRGTC